MFSIQKVAQNLPQIRRKNQNLKRRNHQLHQKKRKNLKMINPCQLTSFIHRDLQSQRSLKKKSLKKKSLKKKSLKKKRKRSQRLVNLAGARPTVEVMALRQSVLQTRSSASMDVTPSAPKALKAQVFTVLPNAQPNSKTWPTIA